jgi:NAD(P)-dependent dehydrogenase (short-subunit alcohol dehydrogenase family)
MINNAGASFRAKVEDISANGWNTVVGINLNGTFFGCKWAAKQMMDQPSGGSIINISSIAGVYGSTMMSHYGASKAAVINFTRALGMAWGRKGVRVNCIAPGPVETEGYLGVLTKQDPAAAKKAYDTVASRVGMGRWGKVEEIAYPCIFLASAASSFMTGETIVIDGGPAPQLGDG